MQMVETQYLERHHLIRRLISVTVVAVARTAMICGVFRKRKISLHAGRPLVSRRKQGDVRRRGSALVFALDNNMMNGESDSIFAKRFLNMLKDVSAQDEGFAAWLCHELDADDKGRVVNTVDA